MSSPDLNQLPIPLTLTLDIFITSVHELEFCVQGIVTTIARDMNWTGIVMVRSRVRKIPIRQVA